MEGGEEGKKGRGAEGRRSELRREGSGDREGDTGTYQENETIRYEMVGLDRIGWDRGYHTEVE